MSGLTDEQLEQERRALLASARRESPAPDARAAGLEALLRGEVKPLDVEPPPLPARRPPVAWFAAAVAVVLLLLWWLAGRGDTLAPAQPALIHDAGTVVTESATPDAGLLVPPQRDVLPAPDAGAEAASVPVTPVDAGVATVRPNAPPADEVDTLAAELKLLDDARAVLKSDPRAALKVLQRYTARFPRGALALEADVVRVEALMASGRSTEARALAKKLLHADRGGLLQERLSRLLPDGG